MKKCTNKNESYSYCPPSYIDKDNRSGLTPGDWRKEQENCAGLQTTNIGSNNYSKEAKKVRDAFKNYFCSPEGSLEWQLERVTRTSYK